MNTIYESINFDNEIRPFVCDMHSNIRKNFSRIHWHENIELIYAFSPTAVYYNGSEILADHGDIIVINSNTLHDIRTCSEEPASYLCVIVDVKLCEALGLDIKNISVNNIIRDKNVSDLLIKMLNEIEYKKKYYIANIKAYICQILVYLCRNYEQDTQNNPINTKNITLVKKVINFINTNYNKDISLGDISKNMEYSKYYLIHTFREMTGLTILDYVNSVRIKESTKLLEKGNMSINEIALSSGFENQSYFSKVFKKYMGCTPSQYSRRRSELHTV